MVGSITLAFCPASVLFCRGNKSTRLSVLSARSAFVRSRVWLALLLFPKLSPGQDRSSHTQTPMPTVDAESSRLPLQLPTDMLSVLNSFLLEENDHGLCFLSLALPSVTGSPTERGGSSASCMWFLVAGIRSTPSKQPNSTKEATTQRVKPMCVWWFESRGLVGPIASENLHGSHRSASCPRSGIDNEMGWPSATTTQNARYGYVPARPGDQGPLHSARARIEQVAATIRVCEQICEHQWAISFLVTRNEEEGTVGNGKGRLLVLFAVPIVSPTSIHRASRNGSRVGAGREKLHEAKRVSVGNNGNVGVGLEERSGWRKGGREREEKG
ncbi:hypothetical protein K438DRAFT_1761667 [Mycena galopus ATCC 62051]|nr:hypothetical protein K438DRAFT_1761667 [Mycena galopus ATCC 62051]